MPFLTSYILTSIPGYDAGFNHNVHLSFHFVLKASYGMLIFKKDVNMSLPNVEYGQKSIFDLSICFKARMSFSSRESKAIASSWVKLTALPFRA